MAARWLRQAVPPGRSSCLTSIDGAIVLRFMQPDLIEHTVGKATHQTLPELDYQHLGGRNNAFQPGYVIVEVFMINPANNLLLNNPFHLSQVEEHAGARVRLAAQSDFQNIIVSVSVGIRAFIIQRHVLRLSQMWTPKAVRSAE